MIYASEEYRQNHHICEESKAVKHPMMIYVNHTGIKYQSRGDTGAIHFCPYCGKDKKQIMKEREGGTEDE